MGKSDAGCSYLALKQRLWLPHGAGFGDESETESMWKKRKFGFVIRIMQDIGNLASFKSGPEKRQSKLVAVVVDRFKELGRHCMMAAQRVWRARFG